MKLRRYLKEKYVTGFKLKRSGDIIDVMKNPSPKELKEVEHQSFNDAGFRFLIDFKQKDVYVWADTATHDQIFDKNPLMLPTTSYNLYTNSADDVDRYFTGHVESGQVKSDIWFAFKYKYEHDMGMFGVDINNFRTMQKHNKSWISKYGINPREVQKIVDAVVKAYPS
jgi:hypothetical protein